jgi:hypothetical protein
VQAAENVAFRHVIIGGYDTEMSCSKGHNRNKRPDANAFGEVCTCNEQSLQDLMSV